jgi:hypothetical protein
MADTININIDIEDDWKEIASAGSCFVTASKSIEYLESTTTPLTTLVGHHLKTFDSFQFKFTGEKLFARGSAIVIITEG